MHEVIRFRRSRPTTWPIDQHPLSASPLNDANLMAGLHAGERSTRNRPNKVVKAHKKYCPKSVRISPGWCSYLCRRPTGGRHRTQGGTPMGIGNWLSLGQLNDSDGATELRGVVDRHGDYDGGYVLMVRAGQIYDPDHSCDGIQAIAIHAGTGLHAESDWGDGVFGYTKGDGNSGAVGKNDAGGYGVYGHSARGTGVYGESPAGDGVFGYSTSNDNSGAVGKNDAGGYGVYGHSEQGTGIFGESLAVEGDRMIGVHGVAVNRGTGVKGETQNGTGVLGETQGGPGVSGKSVSGPGVEGRSGSYVGVDGFCLNGTGVHGLGGDSGVTGTSQKGYGGTFGGPRARAAIRLLPAETPGAPTTGTHQVGELFVDSQGALYYCRKGGTPGTWVTLAP